MESWILFVIISPKTKALVFTSSMKPTLFLCHNIIDTNDSYEDRGIIVNKKLNDAKFVYSRRALGCLKCAILFNTERNSKYNLFLFYVISNVFYGSRSMARWYFLDDEAREIFMQRTESKIFLKSLAIGVICRYLIPKPESFLLIIFACFMYFVHVIPVEFSEGCFKNYFCTKIIVYFKNFTVNVSFWDLILSVSLTISLAGVHDFDQNLCTLYEPVIKTLLYCWRLAEPISLS